MGVLGAPPGDWWKCLNKNMYPMDSDAYIEGQEACGRIYFGYFLFPRLQHELERLKLIEKVPPIPGPGPDPGPLFEAIGPRLLLGEPNPQPSLSAKARLKTATTFREALQNVTKQLDDEIGQLEKRASRETAE